MNEMTITFNGQSYIPIYNEQTGYYEIELQAPQTGGIYEADISFSDFFEEEYTDSLPIQIWAKEPIKLDTNKVFMWIFDCFTFEVKDIVELSDYEINIDEETNSNTILKVLKKITAKAKDIIAIKKNNEVVYWGMIDNIQNEDGKILYEYTLKYITNIFDQTIKLETTEQTVNEDNVENGLYVVKFNQDTSKVWDVNGIYVDNDTYIFAGSYNGGANQFFELIKQPNGYYKIEIAHSKKFVTVKLDGTNDVVQYEDLNDDTQLWQIEKVTTNQYAFKSKSNNLYIRVRSSNNHLRAESISTSESDTRFQLLRKTDESIIKYIGVEEQIRRAITVNFTESIDTFVNKDFIQIEVKTQTPKQTSVTNVQDEIYNLHTWMTNCNQLYNIMYEFRIENNKLILTIENKQYQKELIDVQAQSISNYTEVFETDVVSKVTVLYNQKNGTQQSGSYTLYLLNDRTTTTDMTDPNRVDGKVKTVFTENYEDAEQEALNVMKSNSYNHNITFNLYDRYIKVGTPIAIKTKESIIYDTYISAIKITQNKFYEYICGNIRIKFIDKLLKGRKE